MGRAGGAGGVCLGAPHKPWLHPQARGVPPFLLRCSQRKAHAARAIAEGEAFWGGAAGAEPPPVGSCDGAGCAPSSSSSSSSSPPGGSDPAAPCPQEPCVAALARVERTDFLSPMCIGEVANVSAEITYTSKHSVEVQVNVMSENILTGKQPQVALCFAPYGDQSCPHIAVSGSAPCAAVPWAGGAPAQPSSSLRVAR